MASSTRKQLEEWLKTVDVKANHVVDVGGSQLPVKGRTRRWEVDEYTILDLGEPHETKQEASVYHDLNQPSNLGDSDFWHYQIAFCLEVFEYVYNPVEAMKTLNKLLELGGTLYISFPFIYPTHNPQENDYLRYTEFGVRKLLEVGGFEIEELFYRTDTYGGLIEFYREEGMKMAKYDHHNVTGFLVKAKKI